MTRAPVGAVAMAMPIAVALAMAMTVTVTMAVAVPALIASPATDAPASPVLEPTPSPAQAPLPVPVPVATGLDVIRARGFAELRGLRVGLLTNHTGRAGDGAAAIDLLADAPGVRLVALFSPEHGIRGILDATVPSSRDEKTGLPIHSLYGTTRRPTAEMLTGLDAIVIDLQDVGARFYTYMTTMAYVMEAAAPLRIKVVVLDRPNPIGGTMVEGPSMDEGTTSFIGHYAPMPIRHGLTLGELARLFNGERSLGVDLTVVPMTGWRRAMWFDETGQPWINPSPNMRNLHAATLYPGLGAIEFANISVGRGTDTPFEQVGAPWVDGVALAAALNARGMPGIRFYPVRFTPTASQHARTECEGVFIVVTDRAVLRPVRVGVEIASALIARHGDRFTLDPVLPLLGSREGLARLRAGDDPAAIAAGWEEAERRWLARRQPYLIY